MCSQKSADAMQQIDACTLANKKSQVRGGKRVAMILVFRGGADQLCLLSLSL